MIWHAHAHITDHQCVCFKCGRTRMDIANRPYIACRKPPGRKAARVRRELRQRRGWIVAQMAVSV